MDAWSAIEDAQKQGASIIVLTRGDLESVNDTRSYAPCSSGDCLPHAEWDPRIARVIQSDDRLRIDATA